MVTFVRTPLLRIALSLFLAFGLAVQAQAQDRAGDRPVRPSIDQTTQANPRGTDVVEPAFVYKTSPAVGRAADTTLIGVAKIPDPKRNEFGATVNRDLATGTTIRLGDAWVFDDAGLRQSVSFEKGERLVFRPGPHDDVVSLQGVEPLRREVGGTVVFDLQELYESAEVHPLTGLVSRAATSRLRLAVLRMKSTYPGGEAVDLNIVLEPVVRAVPQAIRVVQRDTLVVLADLNYVIHEEVREESPWSAAVMIESGIGQARLSSEVPATQIPAFRDDGYAGTYYVDGTMYLRRGQSRWALRALGISSVNHTDFIEMANHQVALFVDARFEHGTRNFMLLQASGELTDKLHQEFDWNSADYAAEALFGFGRRFFNKSGFEKSRLEALVGVRMGENRQIEVLEIRGKSRGLGPYGVVRAELSEPLSRHFLLHAGISANGYAIYGLGPQDEGFSEEGFNISSNLKIGRPFLGVSLRAGITAMWWVKRADLVDGMQYVEKRVLIAPGVSLETYL